MPTFTPTRDAALETLAAFLPEAGARYGERRNFDVEPPATSRLSPWLRHRLILESEVLRMVRAEHGERAAEKFISEVVWRTYWKGWLEMRPSVWRDHRRDLDGLRNRIQTESGLRADWQAACTGDTGIACFDHWAKELADTGWLHNHARMWFASIWIFTLRLPWQLGADLFLRLLIDGDPASNTLGWRWVAGLQTPGKHYVATAGNIRRFTGGRFDPRNALNETPEPLDGPGNPDPGPLPQSRRIATDRCTGLLLTTADLAPGALPGGVEAAATFALDASAHRSLWTTAPLVSRFAEGALRDAGARLGHATVTHGTTADDILAWVERDGIEQVVHAHAPVGPEADVLAEVAQRAPDLRIAPQVRPYDAALWPNAGRGFFRFKKDMPELSKVLG
jgi:deoxyribodipyrimidine photo-lyase